jgi:hypothetical protein
VPTPSMALLASRCTKPKYGAEIPTYGFLRSSTHQTDVMPKYRTYTCAVETTGYPNSLLQTAGTAIVCWQQNMAVMRCCQPRYGASLRRNINTCRTAVPALHKCLLRTTKLKSPQGRSTLPLLECCILFTMHTPFRVTKSLAQQQVHSTPHALLRGQHIGL